MSRRFVQKNTIPRAQLRQYGVRIDWENQLYRWKDSWHESESFMFTTNALKCCDECNYYFTKGELVSKGIRQIYPDAPLPVEGIDMVHLKCDDCYKDMDVKDVIKKQDVTKFGNFSFLSREEKIQWLTDAGQDISLADDKLPLEGFKFVVTGNFRNKDELLDLIASNGGSVSATMSKTCTHCLLGSTGYTEYGQVTGIGSKKYKEAVKGKCVMVTPEELKVLIEKPVAVEEEIVAEEVVVAEGDGVFVVSTVPNVEIADVKDENEGKGESSVAPPVVAKKAAAKGKKTTATGALKTEPEVVEEVEEPANKRAKRGSKVEPAAVVAEVTPTEPPTTARRSTRSKK